MIRESYVQRRCTIDHEFAHYIQYVKNSELKEGKPFLNLLPGYLYWIIGGRMNMALTEKAFIEGFATYVTSLTRGIVKPPVEKAIRTIQSGKRWRMLLRTESLSYALGYLTYSAIAKAKSEKYAISIGLFQSPSKWVSEGEKSKTNMGTCV